MSSYQHCSRRARAFLSVLAWSVAGFDLFPVPVCAQTNQATSLYQQANSLYQEANKFYAAGRFSEAIPLAQRALTILEEAVGSDHIAVAQSLNTLANLYFSQRRYADAEPLYKRSIAVIEKLRGPDDPDVAKALSNLALMYHQGQARYVEAEPLYLRSLAIQEKALRPDDPDIANSLNNLALLYYNQGRYTEAEPLLRRSLDILEKALGQDHSRVADSLTNLANVYRSQGRYSDAEPLLWRSVAIQERVFGPDHSRVAASLNNLALLYQAQGRYVDAEPLYKRALAIGEAVASRGNVFGPQHADVGMYLKNLGSLYYEQRRYADAEAVFKRSVIIEESIFGPDHPSVAQAVSNLANLFVAQRHYAEAEPLYKRSLGIQERVLGPDHGDVAVSASNLASLYADQGHYGSAEPLFRRSLAIREKVLGPSHPEVALSLNNLALLYQLQGRYTDALPLVRTAAQKGFPRKQVYLATLTGAVSRSILTPADAIDEGYQIVQRTMLSAASNAINQLSVRFAVGNGQLADLVRKDQDLGVENDRLDKNIVEAVSREPGKRDGAEEQQIRDRLQAIATERAQIETTLNKSFPDFAALAKPAPLSVQETQALLADDEALIILDFDSRSYGGVITRTRADGGELNISAKDVEAQVNSLRSSLIDKADTPFDVKASYRLYQSVFGAFADKFASTKRLSVVTNGALTSIPLQLLVTGDPTEKKLKDVDWFVRSHAITVLPSVASLKTLRGRAPMAAPSKPMIAFADPVFSKMAKRQARQQVAARGITSFVTGTQIDVASLAEYLPQLPSTRDEVQSIAKVLRVDPNDIRLGLDATETAVKNANLDQYRIVYFATHGLVAGDLEKFAQGKVEPALALSIPDKPNDFDNGLLSASEVAQLKLNADWVVLSACNTAAEDRPGAEALSGLARAFFYAGARSLLVSHWEVDDEATAKLMTKIFLVMGDNPMLSHGEALQQSILAIFDSASSDEELHPRLWAPFVVVGEPEKPN